MTGFNPRTDRPVPRTVTAAVILIYVSLATSVGASIIHGRNAIITLIVALPIAAMARRCYAGTRGARLPQTVLCGFIVLQAVIFAPPFLRSTSVADQILGLVDIAIAAIYIVAAVLLWASASTEYFDADPRWRLARQPQSDVAGQADTSQQQAGLRPVASPTDGPPDPLRRRQNILIAVLFGALAVLIAGLALLAHSTSSESPEKAGYRFGTLNSDPTVTDCNAEGERRYRGGAGELDFAVGCVQAQFDALNATNPQPTP